MQESHCSFFFFFVRKEKKSGTDRIFYVKRVYDCHKICHPKGFPSTRTIKREKSTKNDGHIRHSEKDPQISYDLRNYYGFKSVNGKKKFPFFIPFVHLFFFHFFFSLCVSISPLFYAFFSHLYLIFFFLFAWQFLFVTWHNDKL